MILTRSLVDAWDPQWNFRNHRRLTVLQCISIPLVVPIAILFTLPIDILTLPYQIRLMNNNSD